MPRVVYPYTFPTDMTIGCCVSNPFGLLPVVTISVALAFDGCTLWAFLFFPVPECFYPLLVGWASVLKG